MIDINTSTKPRCGICRWANETEAAGNVQCRGGPPSVHLVPDQRGISLQAFFPMVNAEEGWCRLWEYGEPKKLSKIIKPTLDPSKLKLAVN